MSLHVALIDKSEIVQKMLSHCLYYFSAEVLRFDSWEDSKSHFADSKPDIIFVDWEIKKGEESVVYSVIEEMKPTPVVLLYRSSYGPQINAIPSDKLSHKFIKPLDLKAIREGFIELVPQVKESKIHPFLKFPKSKAVDQSSGSELKENTISAKTYSKISLIKENDPKTPISHLQTRIIQKSLEEDKIPVGNILNPVNKTNPEKEVAQTSLSQQASAPVDGLTEPSTAKEGIQTSFSQQASGVLKEKKIDMNAISKTSTKELLIEELGIGKDQTKDEAATKNLKEDKPLEKTVSERKEPDVKSFKKQEFNIDENTQNDFAPMAIKFSDSGQGKLMANQNIELSEKDILKVLNKYKDTLEFQQLMENVLSEYAKEAVTNILQGHTVTDILQKPLVEFKESKQFKDLVERQISEYVKQQLPLIIKVIVAQEIKKIIGD